MTRHRELAALGAGLLFCAGGWLLLHKKASGGTVPSAPTWNTTHEKAFLTEQLRRNPNHTPIVLRLAQIERAEGDLAGARRASARPPVWFDLRGR